MDKETFKKLFKELVKSKEIQFVIRRDCNIYEGTETLTGLSVEVDGKSVGFFDIEDRTYGI